MLHFAYMRLGISSRAAFLLLVASLLGSYVNIPVAQLPEQEILSNQEIGFFGMRYVVPTVVDWPGTIIAVNVGGAVIPGLLSLYLLAKHNLWTRGLLRPHVWPFFATSWRSRFPEWVSQFRRLRRHS